MITRPEVYCLATGEPPAHLRCYQQQRGPEGLPPKPSCKPPARAAHDSKRPEPLFVARAPAPEQNYRVAAPPRARLREWRCHPGCWGAGGGGCPSSSGPPPSCPHLLGG